MSSQKNESLLDKVLSFVSDEDLLIRLHASAREERKITAYIITLLQEVEYRKLYLKNGYGSLIEFCIKELKYSESSAYRRVAAMRLSNDLPEVKTKIIEGTLSLSVISQAQTFIRQEEKSSGKRLELCAKNVLLKELENKSSREAEKILIEKSPDQIRPERIRALTTQKSELTLTLDESTLNKLNKIKWLVSHKNPNPSYAELIEIMAEVTLEKLDPEKLKTKSDTLKHKAAPTRLSLAQSMSLTHEHKGMSDRYIPAQIKREIWRKSQGQCCFKSPSTNKRCDSRFQLQIDHIIPIAQNGATELSNLQLLCRKHNQLKGFSRSNERIGPNES